MSILMVTCKEASRIGSEALDRKLGFRERVLLRMHLALCEGCRRVDAQYRFLKRAMSEWVESSFEKDAADQR